MKKGNWTEKRLTKLFERYDRVYWKGKLSAVRIVIEPLPAMLGQWNRKLKIFSIDTAEHKSDDEVRSTLLHEMAHVAAGKRGSRGHDVIFFAQLEHLLRMKAPIGVSVPEAGGGRIILADIVPPRFRLLKQKMARAEARRESRTKKYIAAKNLGEPTDTTEDDVVLYFKQCPHLKYMNVVRAIGPGLGLTDEVGRPVTPYARRVLARAKKVHAGERRDYLRYQARMKSLGLAEDEKPADM